MYPSADQRGSLAAVLRKAQEQLQKHYKAKRSKGAGAGAREGGNEGKRVKMRPGDMAGSSVGLSEKHVRRIFRQLIEAVAHMHRHNYAHRDIKIENILFGRDGDVRLADFGFAAIAKKPRSLKLQCGTISYMAPEIFSPNR